MITEDLQEFYSLLQKNNKILAIDYGIRKIGIAFSTPDHKISIPHSVINFSHEKQKLQLINNNINYLTNKQRFDNNTEKEKNSFLDSDLLSNWLLMQIKHIIMLLNNNISNNNDDSDDHIVNIVIGLPKNMDNTDSFQTQITRIFAHHLNDNLPKSNILLQDERLTTKQANNLMQFNYIAENHLNGSYCKNTNRNKSKNRVKVKNFTTAENDDIAASIILQSILR